MEICNRELVDVQMALVKKQMEFERELRYRVAKEAAYYKSVMVMRQGRY